MLSLLVLMLYATSIYSQSSNVENTKPVNLSCTLPPHPKNGRYEIKNPEIKNWSPGDKLSNFTLNLRCDPGYHLTGGFYYFCSNGDSPFLMSECLPLCTNVSLVTAKLVSCGLGETGQEAKCLEPQELYGFNGNMPTEQLNCDYYVPMTVAAGKNAQKAEVPWHAGIYLKTKQPYMQICGGSLVSPTVVISAAHCSWNDEVQRLPASNYAVAVGKIYRPWNDTHDENAQKSDVAEIRIPPRFQGFASNLQDDIALVVVSTPFTYNGFVHPVCLNFNYGMDREHLASGVLGKVAGWGLTGDNGPASPILQTVMLPIIDIEKCLTQHNCVYTA